MHPGRNMKHFRELHGKTLSDVADRLGVAVSTLSRAERGIVAIKRPVLDRWLTLFFIDEDALRSFRIPDKVTYIGVGGD